MYIKKFEQINTDVQVGDYVICKDTVNREISKMFNDFLSKNIGKVVKINDNGYFVIFDNVPKSFLSYAFLTSDVKSIKEISFKKIIYQGLTFSNISHFSKEEIEYHSKNKKDLETILKAKQYNL